MTEKLTRAQREQIIFAHLKGKDDPLYEVVETKHGKYIVKPKQVDLEEEESAHESIAEEEEDYSPPPPPPKKRWKSDRVNQSSKHRTKQDAKRLLDALTSLINSDDSSYESEGDYQRAPPLVEPNNYKPTNLNYKRRRLAF